jgi:hypothetical protein
MSKKLFLCLIFFILPLLLLAQDAEDIIVPQGYKVKKIAETNRAIMPRGMTFDASGNRGRCVQMIKSFRHSFDY